MVYKAVFDGQVYRPAGPVPDGLRPGDPVDVLPPIADVTAPKLGEPGAAWRLLAESGIEGPEDWSSQMERKYPNGPD